jgi:cytochrome P450
MPHPCSPPELDPRTLPPGTPLIELLTAAHRLGPVAALRLGDQSVVLVTGPEEVCQVLATGSARFTKRAHRARALLGDGLISATGEPWKRQRRRLQPYFTAVGLRSAARHITAAADRLAGHWSALAAAEATTDVGDDMRFFALDTIWRVLTGTAIDPHSAERFSAIATVVAALPTVGATSGQDTDPTVAPLLARIDRAAYELIETTREQLRSTPPTGARRGLLHDLLTPGPDDKCAYADTLIRDELVTLIVAGHETTATALTWLHLLLHRHPRWRAWALARGPEGSPARQEACQALISETLRLYPPIWLIPRYVPDDGRGATLGQYLIPSGTRVLTCPYLTQRSPELFPDPDSFDPARFLPGRRLAHGAHHPFGIGPRACLGQQFALREMRAVLEVLLPYAPHFTADPPSCRFASTLLPEGDLKAVVRRASPE